MKPNECLDDTFGITPEVQPVKLTRREKESLRLADVSEMKEKDIAFVRGKLYEMAEKLSEAANESLDVALESSHPRAFEVTANTMKLCADVAEKITDLHSKKKQLDIDEVSVKATQNNTTNNVFMSGSTADLMRMLKESQQDTK